MKLRLIAAVAATALITTLSLTGCAPSASADCVKVSSGSASDAVKVTGEFGGSATVDVGSGVKADSLQRTVVTKGDGAVPATGQSVDVLVTIFAGSTGDRIDAVTTTLTANDPTLADPVRAGLDCLAVGTRSVSVFPATDLYPAEQLTSLGLAADESLILVVDVIALKEDPTVNDWSTGVPTVTFGADGTPSIDLSAATTPEGIAVKILKEGTGREVAANDSVKVNYYGVTWSDGTSFDGNYGQDPAEFTLTGVIPGFRAALVGQKVGTQLLVSIPAKYAYGEGTASTGNALVGQDLLFLIDIVDAVPPTK